MDRKNFSRPLSLRSVQITDDFWKKEMELVRTQMLPYQWDALNDQVEGAVPSYCMRNFKIAGKKNLERREQGETFREPPTPSAVLRLFHRTPNTRKINFTGLFSRTVISINGLRRQGIPSPSTRTRSWKRQRTMPLISSVLPSRRTDTWILIIS